MILLAIIDGAGPDAPVEDQDAETRRSREWERARTANGPGKRAAEHDENGGNGGRTSANERITQMHVF
jgi:hypothetical protein